MIERKGLLVGICVVLITLLSVCSASKHTYGVIDSGWKAFIKNEKYSQIICVLSLLYFRLQNTVHRENYWASNEWCPEELHNYIQILWQGKEIEVVLFRDRCERKDIDQTILLLICFFFIFYHTLLLQIWRHLAKEK